MLKMNAARLGFGLTALLALPGCPDAVAEATSDTEGIDSITASGTGTTGVPTTTDAPTSTMSASGSTTTDGPDTDTATESDTDPTCEGEPNDCGGCDALPEVLGEACNGCEGLSWMCAGENAVVCDGFDPQAEEYWPDEDGDGEGDADHPGLETCEEAPEGWVTTSKRLRRHQRGRKPRRCGGLQRHRRRLQRRGRRGTHRVLRRRVLQLRADL